MRKTILETLGEFGLANKEANKEIERIEKVDNVVYPLKRRDFYECSVTGNRIILPRHFY